jgi:hypothetical protein
MTKKTEDKEYWIWIIGSLFVILILGLWYYTYCELKGLDANDRGTFGDMFGSVNAIYSGLAFAGIIFTILLQRKELRYQREELKETRQEFITQNKTLKAQRFENIFFNLVSLHNQIVNDIDYDKRVQRSFNPGDSETVIVKGRDVFRDRFNNLHSSLKESTDFNETYLEFYEKRKTDFGHYFRNLYRIIKMVHQTEFIASEELENRLNRPCTKEELELCNYIERYKYTCIVRAQLSDYELLLLFYNCLSDNGIEKFKPLVEEYALLKNLPTGDIFDQSLIGRYSVNAFKNKNENKNCA